MRLYSLPLSPYAARCRLQVHLKGLDDVVEVAMPPGGWPATDAYRALTPFGKVPTLELDDGTVIPESAVIAEYLEERFPEPPLLPEGPEARARVRLLARLGEIYVMPAMRPLFAQFFASPRDEAAVAAGVAAVGRALDRVEAYMVADATWAAGPSPTLADCGLVPFLFAAVGVLGGLGVAEPLAGRRRLDAYWGRARAEPAVDRVLGEMEAGLARMIAGRTGGGGRAASA